MSTKIYDGLKLKDPNADLFEIIPKIIAPAIREEFHRLSLELVTNHLSYVMCSPKALAKMKKDTAIFFGAEEDWLERQKELGDHHFLNDPLRFSVVFGRSHRGNILSVPFYEKNKYFKALEGTGLFDKYGYWDNTDRPDEISKKVWNQRRDEWDSILSKNGTFGDLPSWELGETKNPWFSVLLSKTQSEDKAFKVNEIMTAKKRINNSLRAEVTERLPNDKTPASVIRNYSLANELVKKFAETVEYKTIPQPEPLPEDVMVNVGDITPYVVPREYVEAVLALNENDR